MTTKPHKPYKSYRRNLTPELRQNWGTSIRVEYVEMIDKLRGDKTRREWLEGLVGREINRVEDEFEEEMTTHFKIQIQEKEKQKC